MKFFHLLVFALFFFTSCQGQDKNEITAATETADKVEVIDFHTTNRCQTCLKIEYNVKSLLESSFKKDVDAGTLVLRIINIDEEANYQLAERFEAAGTALFINVIKDNKEQHIDLTNFAFMKAYDEEEFAAELKAKIEDHLKTL